MFGTATSKKYRDTLSKKKCSLVTSLRQHAKNAKMLLQCDKCGKWTHMYSLRKLTTVQHKQLMGALEEMFLFCGAPLADLDLPDDLPVVLVKGLFVQIPQRNFIILLDMKLFVTFMVQTKKALHKRLIFIVPFALPVIAWKKLGRMENSCFPSNRSRWYHHAN